MGAMVPAVPCDNRLYKLTNCITGDLVGLQPIREVVTANGGAQTEQSLSCSWKSAGPCTQNAQIGITSHKTETIEGIARVREVFQAVGHADA